jgi:hypothetical protein
MTESAMDKRRVAKRTFALMAVGSVLVGVAVYLCQKALGIDEDTGRLLSSALLAVGITDTLVLYWWDRLFGGGTPPAN